MKSVLIIGGYGTFGSHVSKALAERGISVVVAGRDCQKAKEFARALGSDHREVCLDLRQRQAIAYALREQPVVVNCAGPFRHFDSTLLEACLEAGCHYADIADDRHYCALVRQHDERFNGSKLAAVYGCSSLPGISGALGLELQERMRQRRDGTPSACRVTLFIGNDNPKGLAAVASLVEGLGKAIAAPQGTLRCFHGREVVPLPPPFDRRVVFNFDSPEYDLFPLLFGTQNVRVNVGFELTFGSYIMHALARFGSHYSAKEAKWITRGCELLRGWGCSGGAVMTEFLFAGGAAGRATMLSRTDGQRMAAWPCVLVAEALAKAQPGRTGACTAFELLGAQPMLTQMVATGFELHFAP
jgi:hypothetical protein